MASNLPASHAKQVADFLQKVKTARGRIAFVIDATMSREQTWDAAAQLQAEMFSEAAKLGGLEMQVTYFRGVDEVKSSNWTSDARELQHFMGRVRCEAGYTKYAQAFAQVRKEHGQQAISAMVVVGDMLEEEPRTPTTPSPDSACHAFVFRRATISGCAKSSSCAKPSRRWPA
jgi:hypothetical protein